MRSYPPWVWRDLDVVPRGNSHRALATSNQPVGLGLPQRARRYRPGGSALSSPGYWICRYMEGFLIWGRNFIPPGWCWLHEHQVGVSTPCGEVSTWGITVFVPGLWWRWVYKPQVWVPHSCEAVSTRGTIFFVPVFWCRWLYEPQVEVSTPCKGGIDPGDHRFRPSFVGVVDVWKDF